MKNKIIYKKSESVRRYSNLYKCKAGGEVIVYHINYDAKIILNLLNNRLNLNSLRYIDCIFEKRSGNDLTSPNPLAIYFDIFIVV